MSDWQEIINFLQKYNAYKKIFRWEMKNITCLQDIWDKAPPECLIWLATRKDVLTNNDLHEFGLWSVEQIKHLIIDKRSLNALRVKRLWLDGKVPDDKLKEARTTAWDATWDAMRLNQGIIKWYTLRAASSVAGGNRKSSTWSENEGAAEDAAFVIGNKLGRKSQAGWLRKKVKPCWGNIKYF